MGGFSLHPLLRGTKVKITAVYQNKDFLYIGTATGSVRVYAFDGRLDTSVDGLKPSAPKLLKTHSLCKRPIDQIGILAQSQQIVILCESTVTLYPLAELTSAQGQILGQARNAHSFATTSFDPSSIKGKRATEGAEATTTTELRDLLVIGCRKKVVVFGAGKNGLKDAWELTLPHSPRQVILPPSGGRAFALPKTIHLLYSPQSSVILQLNPLDNPHLSIAELPNDPPPPVIGSEATGSGNTGATTGASEGTGGGGGGGGVRAGVGGALSGLGGYVGLGGKAVNPAGTGTVGGEALIARDDIGVFISSEGNYTRPNSLQWPAPPDCLAFSNPFIYSVSTSSTPGPSGSQAASAVQIHLSPTLHLRQTLSLPLPSAGSLSTGPMSVVSSDTATAAAAMSSSVKIILVSTPSDKTLLQNEGSAMWAISSGSVGEQVDDLVREGRLGDAIGLVESVGEAGLDPSRRLRQLRILQAVTQFAAGRYQTAMETFLVYNVNPALVVSLFPAKTISGKLHRPRSEWMNLFGAVDGARLAASSAEPTNDPSTAAGGGARGLLKSVVGLGGGGGLAKKPSVDSLRPGSPKNAIDDAASVNEESAAIGMTGEEEAAPRPALEALMYYLSDRRQKVTGAIAALTTPLPAESDLPALSALSATDLHALPSQPMTELSNQQLLRVAQIIYTALLKVYLVARPVLVGSLCRIENWCDVEEVEELLKAQKKFSDLIDLYQGKKMHAKALAMLHQLAEEEDDPLDRFPTTIRYLQKLGPDYLSLILESSEWILRENWKMGLQIYTADEPEVDALPRKEVANFLRTITVDACAGYLEHVIMDLQEDDADLHDKLAEVWLDRAKSGWAEGSREDGYKSLLSFLTASEHYRANRLIQRLPANEARAVLLGRLGKHEEALRIYIYRLKDYAAAEAHCAKVYKTNPDSHGIYLNLLTLYLRPSPSDPVLLEPALELIAKHGPHIDSGSVLDLLPPLVTVAEVQAFFVQTLRDGRAKANQRKVVEGLISARKEELDRVLMRLQTKRVRITEQRICPQCQKRLGQSAIAVHAPRGEVTHLHCKDQFSARLAAVRG